MQHPNRACISPFTLSTSRCAGKKLHRDLLFDENSVPSYLVGRFIDECLQHSKLRHPNIVQLMGVHFPERSIPVPTIVMEYLPMTLCQCLCKYPRLPAHIEGSILLDVVSGLDYLHRQSPPIMHRDLTANNVLLTNHMQAKVSDLGQAKILDPSSARKQTTAPGTECYMPPEALVTKPVYSTKIDVFSFGVLILHVCTHEWPLREKVIDPKTHQERPATEFEKRRKYFDKVVTNSLLYRLAKMCLENNPEKRPNTSNLVEEISGYCPASPFVNTLEMQFALESESTKAQVLETHLQEVDIQVRAISDNLNTHLSSTFGVTDSHDDSLVLEACVLLHDITFANTSALASTGSAELIVGYKSPTSNCKHNLHICPVEASSSSVVTGNMDVIVRAPLSIHFTGTHIRTIEGIKEPWGLAANNQGQFFVVTGGYKGVLLYSRTGESRGSYVESLRRYDMQNKEGMCWYPRGIAINRDGFILADTWCHRVQKFKLSSDLSEAIFERSAGTEGDGEKQFKMPMGIRVSKTSGDIYVCDKENHRIQVLDQQLQFKRNFGKEGDGPSDFRRPVDIDFDSKGNIYVADSIHCVIKVFSRNWEYQGVIGKKGHGKGSFDNLTSICVDKHDYIYATEKSWNCVQVFNPGRDFVMQFQLPGISSDKKWNSEPFGITVDDEGFVYVSCKATGCVHVYK